MYENLWGKQHGYKDGVFIDPVSRLTFAVAGTAEGDGCYRGSDDSNFPVDSGTIGIIPPVSYTDLDVYKRQLYL